MTATVLVSLAVVVVVAALYAFRRLSGHAQSSREVDLGVVSTRWISELRRDEPWTRS